MKPAATVPLAYFALSAQLEAAAVALQVAHPVAAAVVQVAAPPLPAVQALELPGKAVMVEVHLQLMPTDQVAAAPVP
jgi:hypothetical protein